MNKNVVLLIPALLCAGTMLKAQSIVSPSDRRQTTQHLSAGTSGFKIGITSNAGGIINEIILPNIKPGEDFTDIMGNESDSYGRSGQSSIRDLAHRSKYNPTQAGFNETLGTNCTILVNGVPATFNQSVASKLTVSPFQLALWKADGDYDFTEYEAGGLNDSYSAVNYLADDNTTPSTTDQVTILGDNSNSDNDNLTEDASVTHAMEIGSPFHYFGEYENFTAKVDGVCAVIKHTFEYRFDMVPNHSMEQFRFGNIRKNAPVGEAGMPILDISQFTTVQWPKNPTILPKPYTTTYKDMSHLHTPWSIRMDLNLWKPQYRHVQRVNGTWETSDRTVQNLLRSPDNVHKQLIILSHESNSNSTSGQALGLYRPNSAINRESIIGYGADDQPLSNYEYNRSEKAEINDSYNRAPNMSWVGFFHGIQAMVNTTALGAGRYETYRQEYYILYGTPKQIKDGVAKIDAQLIGLQSGSMVVASANTNNNNLTLINNNLDEQTIVYPNPASELVNINMGAVAQDVTILDITGRVVYSKKAISGVLTIPSAQIGEPGTYVIKTNNKTQKLIIK